MRMMGLCSLEYGPGEGSGRKAGIGRGDGAASAGLRTGRFEVTASFLGQSIWSMLVR